MRTKLLGVLALTVPSMIAMTTTSASGWSLTDQGVSGCVSAWSGGAYAAVKIEDNGVWNSARSLHINYSNASGDLWNCVRGGRATTGTKKIQHAWTVRGSGLSSCTLGIDLGCTITDNNTVAATSHQKSASNGDGHIETSMGGANVYASANGELNLYNHSVTVTFSKNGSSAIAKSANQAIR